MRAAVIIPIYNVVDFLDAAIASAIDAFEIIVIDDHSSDETAARVHFFKEELPNLRLLRLSDYLTDADQSGQSLQFQWRNIAFPLRGGARRNLQCVGQTLLGTQSEAELNHD